VVVVVEPSVVVMVENAVLVVAEMATSGAERTIGNPMRATRATTMAKLRRNS
jgi:hypothetical protein